MAQSGAAYPEPRKELYKTKQDLKLKGQIGNIDKEHWKTASLKDLWTDEDLSWDTGETSGDIRLKKGKDGTFLVWCGTQKANVIFGCTLFRAFHHGIEGDSSTLNDIHETYSRKLHLVWFVWLQK